MLKKGLILLLVIFSCLRQNVAAVQISAKSAAVVEAEGGRILYEKNARARLPMASTTKIMTAFLAVERGNLGETVVVDARAAGIEGSSMYLKAGDAISLEELVYGVMLQSGNDAAAAVAIKIGGSIENFADMMTARAKELGAHDTQFKNPNGLDDEGHYTTALDLAVIAAAALESPRFSEIVGTKKYQLSYNNAYLVNHNKLLNMYEGCDGVKTGFTKKSGRCLVSSATRGGRRLVAVTLNAPDDWRDHARLLDFCFSEFKERRVCEKNGALGSVRVKGGAKAEISAEYAEGLVLYLSDSEAAALAVKTYIPQELDAPVKIGQKIGEMRAISGETLLGRVDILAGSASPVEFRPGAGDIFAQLLRQWLLIYSKNKMTV